MINSTNHLGWRVQLLTDAGWYTVEEDTNPSKEEQEESARCLRILCPHREWRVYEVVK